MLKKKLLYLIILLALIISLSKNLHDSIFVENANEIETKEKITKEKAANEENDDITHEQISIGDVSEMPISRALVAKMLSLSILNSKEISLIENKVEIKDCDKDDWFYKYVVAAVDNKWIEATNDEFRPLESITYKEVLEIVDALEFNSDNYIIMDESVDKNSFVTYDDWVRILDVLIKKNIIKLEKECVKQSLIIVGTPTNCEELSFYEMVSDKGKYKFSGLIMDKWIDKKVSVLTNGREVVAVLGILDEAPVITNVFLQSIDNDDLTIFVGGVNRSYKINEKYDVVQGDIGDIKIEEGLVKDLKVKRNIITGVVKSVENNLIQFDNNRYEVAEDIKVYSFMNNQVYWKNISDLVVGTDLANYIYDDKKICGAIIIKKPELEKIRVVINKKNYSGLVFDKLEITATSDYQVLYGNEKKEFKQGDWYKVDTKLDSILKDKRILITPINNEGRLIIKNIYRGRKESEKEAEYRGTFEISKKDGGYIVVNEVDFEEYLYSVIPSEMPSSYGLIPSKVQAISARSYAYNQFYSNKFHEYGAHVDDSTNCQVYNNIPENETSIKAVNETNGICITDTNNNVISANYFSTSCGYTANAGEVFLGNTPKYLSAKSQVEGKVSGDLSKEKDFYEFIKSPRDDAYEKDFGWFRWKTTMTLKEVENSINHNLYDRYKAHPERIKTLNDNNIFKNIPVDTIGNLEDINVYKRGEGGNIVEIVLEGTQNIVKIISEYDIRKIIVPYQYDKEGESIIIQKQDGTTVENYSMMPSAFYSIEKIKDKDGKLMGINIYGGGFGHGVGMSQNGVKGMSDEGFSYEDIIKHYYEGVIIKQILSDS